MIGQQGQAEGQPQEAGGQCGGAVGNLAAGKFGGMVGEKLCPI